MKKVLLIAACAVFTLGANAQDEGSSSSKKMWLGGTVAFGSGSSTNENNATQNTSSSRWEFGPEFGYMLNEKMAIGLALSLNGSSWSQDNADEDKSSSFGYEVTPFFRYYFAEAGNFKFLGQLNLGFGGGSTSREDNTGVTYEDGTYSTLNVGINPGVQYWFNDKWSMISTIGLLGYQSRTDKDGYKDANGKDNEVSNSGFGIGADFTSLDFSLIFHF